MRAFIDPMSPVHTGFRVVEVGTEYPVCEPYFWVDCPDGTVPELSYYDGEVKPIPQQQFGASQGGSGVIA